MSGSGRSRPACGTAGGYQAHRRRGEVTCAACCDAHADYQFAWRQSRGLASQRVLQPCGTAAAYRRHLRRFEVACEACRAAHAETVARHQKARAA